MPTWTFEREARTPHSEVFRVEAGGAAVGRLDLHFTNSVTHATLVITPAVDDAAMQELITEVDERLVLSADPYREDLLVTVWRGEEVGIFADTELEDGDEDDDDDLDDDDDEDDDD